MKLLHSLFFKYLLSPLLIKIQTSLKFDTIIINLFKNLFELKFLKKNIKKYLK